jgi:peptidoglycan/LPS O-acetylase OafA/YrhL
MSVLSPTAGAGAERATTSRSLARTTVTVGAGAAVVTTAVAAAFHGAGVPLAVGGEMIPLAGFAQLTFVGAVIGGVLLAVCNRRVRTSARRRFLQVTTALTALSCVPSLSWPPDVATKTSLVALHVLAAAIIVPVLVRHAND